MTGERRDLELGAALQELPVPDHRSGFFETLTAGMLDIEVPARPEETKGVNEMRTLIPKSGEAPTKPRFAHRLAWAVAAAVIVIVAIGLVAVLLPGGDDFVDDAPTIVTSTASTVENAPPTTLPAGAIDLSGFVFPADQVPAFSATIVYDMNPLSSAGSIPAEARLTVRLLFNDSDNYLFEVLSAEPATESMHTFGVPGLSILRSPDQTWIKEPGADSVIPAGEMSPAKHLLWNAAYPTAWDEICATGFEPMGVETVAGRTATHGRCADLVEDYDLWVDTETGIVMRLRGALGFGDFLPATTRDGGFQIIEFELGEVALPTAPVVSETGDPSVLPPFHAVHVEEYSEPPITIVREIWYLDDATWRTEITESNSEEFPVGTFDLTANGFARSCEPSGPYCWEEENPKNSVPMVPVQAPVETLTEHCDLAGEEQILGRSADHFACAMWFAELGPGRWTPGGDLGELSHYWIDRDTGLQLRHESPNLTVFLSTFEINPLFPADVFVYEPPSGTGPGGEPCNLSDPVCEFWSTNKLVKGEPPLNFQGPLIDGTLVSIEDLQGRPAVLLRWADVYASGILDEQLDTFQALYEKWGERVGFLGLPEELPEKTARIMERGGYTFDNMVCWSMEGSQCQPEDGQNLWGIWWGDWVLLDQDGNVFDGFRRSIGTFEHVDSVIEAVLNR